jgi:hypothetical protein
MRLPRASHQCRSPINGITAEENDASGQTSARRPEMLIQAWSNEDHARQLFEPVCASAI